jgi:hypothetical protein
MASTVINQCGLTVYDVSTQITDKTILRLIKKILPNVYIKLNPGNVYCEYLI